VEHTQHVHHQIIYICLWLCGAGQAGPLAAVSPQRYHCTEALRTQSSLPGVAMAHRPDANAGALQINWFALSPYATQNLEAQLKTAAHHLGSQAQNHVYPIPARLTPRLLWYSFCLPPALRHVLTSQGRLAFSPSLLFLSSTPSSLCLSLSHALSSSLSSLFSPLFSLSLSLSLLLLRAVAALSAGNATEEKTEEAEKGNPRSTRAAIARTRPRAPKGTCCSFHSLLICSLTPYSLPITPPTECLLAAHLLPILPSSLPCSRPILYSRPIYTAALCMTCVTADSPAFAHSACSLPCIHCSVTTAYSLRLIYCPVPAYSILKPQLPNPPSAKLLTHSPKSTTARASNPWKIPSKHQKTSPPHHPISTFLKPRKNQSSYRAYSLQIRCQFIADPLMILSTAYALPVR
jgi:hypothetical protein